jgi:hypothetical protein
MPNSEEIHLEYMKELTLYNVYRSEVLFSLSISSFRWMWQNLFSHVKMREYKDVSGKCKTCEVLNRLRSQFSNATLKGLVTELHALHREMYMNER